MRSLRRTEPRLAPDAAKVLASMYLALTENLSRAKRLTALREEGVEYELIRTEAVAGAQRIAYVSRVVWIAAMDQGLLDGLPDDLSPARPLGALARLGYALLALAEGETDPDEPTALLTPAELDGLPAQYRIEAWMQWWAERRAAAEEVQPS